MQCKWMNNTATRHIPLIQVQLWSLLPTVTINQLALYPAILYKLFISFFTVISPNRRNKFSKNPAIKRHLFGVWPENTSYQTSADSTVRVLSVSRFCPDFPENPVRCLSGVCPDFFCLDSVRCPDFVRILKKTQSVVCLSGRTRTRQSCPDFRCPCPPTSASYPEYYQFNCELWIDCSYCTKLL